VQALPPEPPEDELLELELEEEFEELLDSPEELDELPDSPEELDELLAALDEELAELDELVLELLPEEELSSDPPPPPPEVQPINRIEITASAVSLQEYIVLSGQCARLRTQAIQAGHPTCSLANQNRNDTGVTRLKIIAYFARGLKQAMRTGHCPGRQCLKDIGTCHQLVYREWIRHRRIFYRRINY
jgi:hypothetical protein